MALRLNGRAQGADPVFLSSLITRPDLIPAGFFFARAFGPGRFSGPEVDLNANNLRILCINYAR